MEALPRPHQTGASPTHIPASRIFAPLSGHRAPKGQATRSMSWCLQAVYEAKMGKGPKIEEAVAQAIPGANDQGPDGVSKLLERVGRSKSTRSLAPADHTSDQASACSSPGSPVKHGRRAGQQGAGSKTEPPSPLTRAVSQRLPHGNMLQVTYNADEEPPLLQLPQQSILATLRAGLTADSSSSTQPPTPQREPSGGPWPPARTGLSEIHSPSYDKPVLLSPRLRQSKSQIVRFNGGGPADSEDGAGQHSESEPFGRESEGGGLSTATSTRSLGGSGAGGQSARFGRRAGGAGGDRRPSDGHSLGPLGQHSGCLDVGPRSSYSGTAGHIGTSVTAAAAAQPDKAQPFNSIQQEADAARSQFMRLLQGGAGAKGPLPGHLTGPSHRASDSGVLLGAAARRKSGVETSSPQAPVHLPNLASQSRRGQVSFSGAATQGSGGYGGLLRRANQSQSNLGALTSPVAGGQQAQGAGHALLAGKASGGYRQSFCG